MSNYAPGPWVYKKPNDVMRGSRRICSANAGVPNLSIGQQIDVSVANARLIAAAPDQNEALELTQLLLERLGLKSSDEYQRNAAALAKAKG